jgi:acyl carrier protein
MTPKQKIRQFVIENLNWNGDPISLSDDYPLIERHVVDSLGIFSIVSFVEDEFAVEVLDEELVPEHFGTIEGIARLVVSKTERTANRQ